MINEKEHKIKKPWGSEGIWANTSQYVGKVLFIKGGHRLSRQYHEIKDETIMVLSGTLTLEIGEATSLVIREMSPGERHHIRPGTVHRFCANGGDVRLVEVSTTELNDVIRLEDEYGR